MNLIETRGTGVRLIYESCKKAGIKKPEYCEAGDFVNVIFYMEPDILAYKNEEDAILALMRTQESVTAQQLADYLSCSRNTAIRRFGSLIVADKVRKVGRGASVKYVLL